MYAQSTSVSVEKSQAELRCILNRYGCTRFMIMDDLDKTTMMFEVKTRAIRFDLSLPRKIDYALVKRYGKLVENSPEKAYVAREQACRSKWRVLLLCVKAKLEAVECGITTFEEEFLAHFVIAGGRVFGDVAIPALMDSKDNNPNMKTMLALPSH